MQSQADIYEDLNTTVDDFYHHSSTEASDEVEDDG